MPKAELMKWEGSPNFRWVKMHDKERYRVTAKELGFIGDERTKLNTLDSANAWWLKKLHEIIPTPVDPVLAVMQKVAISKGIDPNDSRIKDIFHKNQKQKRILVRAGIPQQVVNNTDIATDIWENLDQIEEPEEPTPIISSKSIAANILKFIKSRKEEIDVTITVGTFDNLRRNLDQLKAYNKEDRSVDQIDFDWFKGWHLHCVKLTKKKSSAWVSEVYSCGKQFVNWLWENSAINSLPRNFKKYSIEVQNKTIIPTFTKDEAKTLIRNATGQLKLHLMLMLNCGWTQIDIATVAHEMVDLNAGTITRKRAKTGKQKAVPIVVYRMWDETLALMKQYKSNDPELFLTTQSGKAWVRRFLDEKTEKQSRTDAIMSNFRHLQKSTKINGEGKSLKIFRKTAADLLRDHTIYSQVAPLFLGHVPSEVIDINYANAANGTLAQAIKWLGEQFGFKSSF